MQQENGISDMRLEMLVLLYYFIIQTRPPLNHLLFLCFLSITSYLSVCMYPLPTLPIRFRPAQITSFTLLMYYCRCRLGRYLSHLSQFVPFSSLCTLLTSSLLSVFPCPVLILLFY